jgi:16S rRNA (guanine(966)-N(2))-methyltransferase RsmD
MRIIAGEFRGRTIAGPTGPGVRPTSDGLRETLFNILGGRVEDAHFIDAYAGTGGVGLEALSRGAARVTFIERNAAVLRVLEQNIAALHVEGRAAVVRSDVLTADARRSRVDAADLVFADPPYDAPDLTAVLIAVGRLLKENGLLVLEYSRRREPPETADGLVRTRIHVAGDSALAFYTSRPAF